jgi:autotransporter passenger strand-loop-strand repeat protein
VSSGHEYVSSGAIASGTVLAAGGRENVVAGGSAVGTTVSSGGAEIVSSGGVVLGTTVLSGGQEIVSMGGQAFVVSGAGNDTIANGGYLELGSGVQGAVSFTGSAGTLVLDASVTFSGTIAGLSASVPNDTIDLRDISISGVTSSYIGNASSGVLTVSGGGNSASLNLIGNFTSSSFHLSNDGSGHVLVSDPAATLFNQAAAGFVVNGGVAVTSAILDTVLVSAAIHAGQGR